MPTRYPLPTLYTLPCFTSHLPRNDPLPMQNAIILIYAAFITACPILLITYPLLIIVLLAALPFILIVLCVWAQTTSHKA